MLHPEKVAEWLLGAPKITRDQSPFYWTYLDRPADGTIFLVWQSMAMGTEYPSDGYIWAPTEAAVQYDTSTGYVIEMHQQKVGYAPNEPVATHSRRRYRLMPKYPTNPPGAQPDPSLWIIHYTQCEPGDRVPSNVIPIDMRVQTTIQTRAYLHQQGQIVQKDFMLHDRSSWPQIAFPRGHTRPRQPMYGETLPPARIPQTMAYPTHQSATGPPPKRVRTQASASQVAAASGVISALDVDDEEDTSRGDLFDYFTPRELSTVRYKQNHEWMEEILSSPYAIHQITPAHLRLGLRGELANLTDGIFDTPLDPEKDVVKHGYVGRLDAGKAEQFRTRVNEHISKTNDEIEKMTAKHAKRMAKLQNRSLVSRAEKELRTAVTDPSDIGPESWRLEGRIDDDDEDGKAAHKTLSKVDDVLAQVEASLGRHVTAVEELRRIQIGGYEEPVPLQHSQPNPEKASLQSLHATPRSGILASDADIEMGNSAASLLDQYHTGLSSTATPGSNFGPSPQTHQQTHSSSGTPALHAPSPQPVSQAPSQSQAPQADVITATTREQTTTTTTDPAGTGDWVVVPPGGVSPASTPAQTSTAGAATTNAAGAAPAPATSTLSPRPTLPNFSASPNDFADLGDLDTAGEALAGYGDDIGGHTDLGLDMDVGMDDSAFGEAFHGVDPRGEGGDPGDQGV